MKQFFLVLTKLLLIINAFSQQQICEKDSVLIEEFYDNVSLKAFVDAQNLDFRLKNPFIANKPVVYNPKANFRVGVSGSYKWLSLSFSLAVSEEDNFQSTINNSKYIDFVFNFFLKRIGGDIYFQRYRGFKLRRNFQVNNYISNPDLQLNNTGVNLFYIFNPNFSLKASFSHSARQIKSVGSIMTMITLFNSAIKSPKPLIPDSISSGIGDEARITGGSYPTLISSFGYSYTFIYKNFYFTPYLLMGAGVQSQYFSETDSHISLALKAYGGISCGYNSQKFFSGISIRHDYNYSKMKRVFMSFLYSTYTFDIGFRF